MGAIPTRGARGPPERGSGPSELVRREGLKVQIWYTDFSGTPPQRQLNEFCQKFVILFRHFSVRSTGKWSESLSLRSEVPSFGWGSAACNPRLTRSPSLGQGLPDTPARRASRGPCLADRAQTRSVRGHIPPSQGRNFACAGIGFPSSASGPSSGPNAASKQDRPRPGKGSKKAKKMAFFPDLRRKVQG